MLRFILDPKAKVGARGPEMSRKKQIKDFLEVNDPFNPLFEKFRNSVLKEFMTTRIHILCSNFTEIVRREMSETMRCFGNTKSSANADEPCEHTVS